MSEMGIDKQAGAPVAPPPDMARGQLLPANPYRLTPEQEAAQQAAAEKERAAWQVREAADRAEMRADQADSLARETRTTALHAALMMEPKPSHAAELIESATAIHGFLTGA